MHNHITVIEDNPARIRAALRLVGQVIICLYFSTQAACQALKHAFACAAGDNKIVRKRCNAVDVQDNDVFPLLLFQVIRDVSC